MKRTHSVLALFLALFFCVTLFVGALPATAEDESVNILACSDFQAPNGNNEVRTNVAAILAAMRKDGITSADGFFCCGDYDYEFTDTKSGITMLRMTVNSFVSSNTVFVQGNHDSPVGTNGLTLSGNNDPAHGKYGTFVINEDDYMWYNDDEDTIQRTTQKLIDYLNEKLAEGFDKPIFILSHLGLHYTMRTYYDGDGKYAHYLFDVLNEAAKKGLNIIYLYGHNHSNGWDDYLGGAAVYLAKGDSILIGQGSNTSKKAETLAFTYLNAGYVGYYSNVNNQDDALTMTYITVTDHEVSFTRYDKNGKHNLKSAGVTNAYKEETGYPANTKIYPSPQSVALTELENTTPTSDLLTIDKTQPTWKKILSADELKDGGRYLIIRNNAPDSIMLPNVVTKQYTDGSERIGFDLLDTADFGDTLAFSSIEDAEWLFTATDGGWLIGDGEAYLTRQQTENQGIAAILTDSGSTLQIKGEGGSFNFYNGSGFSFNYNKRHLINFYTSDPAYFYLYKSVGYLVTVKDGTATANGESVSYAKSGDTLTLTADSASSGYVFDAWTVTGGTITLDDPTKETLTVTMPNEAITLKATYKPMPVDTPDTDSPTTSDPFDNTNDPNPTLWITLGILGSVTLIVIAAVITVVIMKKKTR